MDLVVVAAVVVVEHYIVHDTVVVAVVVVRNVYFEPYANAVDFASLLHCVVAACTAVVALASFAVSLVAFLGLRFRNGRDSVPRPLSLEMLLYYYCRNLVGYQPLLLRDA